MHCYRLSSLHFSFVSFYLISNTMAETVPIINILQAQSSPRRVPRSNTHGKPLDCGLSRAALAKRFSYSPKTVHFHGKIPKFWKLALDLDIMAGRLPVLSTSDLPPASASEQSATASPARGTAMLNSIFKSVRVPEFRFKWQFWAEKGQQSAPSKDKSTASDDFASRPKPLGETIVSVKDFYQHFNNIPTDSLKLRDTIHLFHQGVKPLWEDPRNAKGGAYYFRISKEQATQFWHEICLLAVGDVLQGAVETKRECKMNLCFIPTLSVRMLSANFDNSIQR